MSAGGGGKWRQQELNRSYAYRRPSKSQGLARPQQSSTWEHYAALLLRDASTPQAISTLSFTFFFSPSLQLEWPELQQRGRYIT